MTTKTYQHLFAAAILAACGAPATTPDTSANVVDAAVVDDAASDATTAGTDAAESSLDASMAGDDAATPSPDAAEAPGADAALAADAGKAGLDASGPPAGACASTEGTLKPAGAVCRAAVGPCDQVEVCSGLSADCPADAFLPATAVCRGAVGDCDLPETCSGFSAQCPVDVPRPATDVCRIAVNSCDAAEYCSGSSSTCPVDVWLVDLTSDPSNCGQCGYACYEPCKASACVPDHEWERSPVPSESPVDYTVDTDTVTDNVTGLVWQRVVPVTTYTWADAKSYCATLALAGPTEWRLPTLIELLSIVDSGRIVPSINITAFPNVVPDAFWTSTPAAVSSNYAWFVVFDLGYSVYNTTATARRVRCVR